MLKKEKKQANRNKGALVGLISIAIVLLLFSVDLAYTASWRVEGLKLKWSMSAPVGWIGGNYYQIEKVARETENLKVKLVLREMQHDAKVMDVYLVHMDVTGATTGTLTSLRVNVGRGFGKNSFGRDTWLAYAELLQADHPKGSQTRLLESYSLTTDNYSAYQAIFKTTRPGGGKVYEVMHIVLLSSNRSHIFKLKVDSAKYRKRYAEFSQMLKSIRYKR